FVSVCGRRLRNKAAEVPGDDWHRILAIELHRQLGETQGLWCGAGDEGPACDVAFYSGTCHLTKKKTMVGFGVDIAADHCGGMFGQFIVERRCHTRLACCLKNSC